MMVERSNTANFHFLVLFLKRFSSTELGLRSDLWARSVSSPAVSVNGQLEHVPPAEGGSLRASIRETTDFPDPPQ